MFGFFKNKEKGEKAKSDEAEPLKAALVEPEPMPEHAEPFVEEPIICDFQHTDDTVTSPIEEAAGVLEAVVQPSEPQKQSQEEQQESASWFSRLKSGLAKSSDKLGSGISDIISKRKLDDDTLESLEELLITADIGTKNAAMITANIAKTRYDKEIADQEIKQALAQEIAAILAPVAKPLTLANASPTVVMMVGVNGNGKTTTIGKLARHYTQDGKRVMLCAADTFRAAAVEQLQVWGERNNVPVVTGAHEADAASVAYTALERAKAEGADVLMIDTAGRLQNKANLMEELKKIVRVMQKIDADVPHHVLLTLDATTGQNAVSQAKTFREMVGVNGLIVTKLDGSAKAGVVVALAEQFGLPIHAIGVGEGIDDLRPFDAHEFATNLVGL